MSIILTLSSNSLRNTTMDSDADNIHYLISTAEGRLSAKSMTTIRRLDRETGEYVLVAEWERNMFKSDRVRWPSSGTSDFLSVGDVLKRPPLLSLNGLW